MKPNSTKDMASSEDSATVSVQHQVGHIASVEGNFRRRAGHAHARFEASTAGDLWGRLTAIDFITQAMLFAAVFLLCFFPFLIVVESFAGRSVPTTLRRFLGLNHQAAMDVSHLFTSAHATTNAVTGTSYVLFVLGGYAAAAAFQSLYERVYDFKSGGLQDVVRRLVWLAGVLGAAFLGASTGHFVRDFGGVVLLTITGFLYNFLFFWFTMWLLLGGRAGWRYLLPGALATSFCWMGMLLVFWAVFSNMVIGDYNKYGSIGAVFAFMSFFIAIGVVVILGAMFGEVWRSRDRHHRTTSVASPDKPLPAPVAGA